MDAFIKAAIHDYTYSKLFNDSERMDIIKNYNELRIDIHVWRMDSTQEELDKLNNKMIERFDTHHNIYKGVEVFYHPEIGYRLSIYCQKIWLRNLNEEALAAFVMYRLKGNVKYV